MSDILAMFLSVGLLLLSVTLPGVVFYTALVACVLAIENVRGTID